MAFFMPFWINISKYVLTLQSENVASDKYAMLGHCCVPPAEAPKCGDDATTGNDAGDDANECCVFMAIFWNYSGKYRKKIINNYKRFREHEF